MLTRIVCLQRKPYTAVTVHIERLTSPEYEVDDLSGIIDLIEVIRIQDTGPTEAARALRKKLYVARRVCVDWASLNRDSKYGTSHRQLRSLTILDGLIQNGGGRFQRTFADEALLERLRLLPRDDVVDAEVREKCNFLFHQWAAHYKGVQGLGGIANLSKELPKKARPTAAQSRVLRETERQAQEDPFHADEDDEPEVSPAQQSLQAQQHQQERRRSSLTPRGAGPSSPSTSRRPTLVEQIPSNPITSGTFDAMSSKHKKSKSKSKSKNKSRRQPFDLQRETPKIMQSIASSNIASTNLLNSLKFVNREAGELPSTNKDVMGRFETCKVLRRDVLRYIQLVESEQWIGSLLSANDDLVKALMAWEVLEK